jgi:PPOX class probable F420-dependent enzyme
MAQPLPEQAKEILDDKAFATFATVEADGTPQLSVVWVERDGDELLVSTTTTRRKHANLSRTPRASLLVIDPQNPYAYLEVRGQVSMTEEGGRELIDRLGRRYTGADRYTGDDGTDNVRVVVRLTPERARWNG